MGPTGVRLDIGGVGGVLGPLGGAGGVLGPFLAGLELWSLSLTTGLLTGSKVSSPGYKTVRESHIGSVLQPELMGEAARGLLSILSSGPEDIGLPTRSDSSRLTVRLFSFFFFLSFFFFFSFLFL